jgi:glucose/arabinose dehydrogenase
VEKAGFIRILDLATQQVAAMPFLDVSASISSVGEGGLIGLAVDPDYASNGFFYVNVINTSGDTEIRRYQVSANNPLQAEPATATLLLTVDQPAGLTNHKAGWLGFGRDGYLYAALGDGGGGNDPDNNAQNPDILLGKMLRLDVHTDDFPEDSQRNYGIPADNPFVGTAGADEIWAFGLRNPWRPSFDRGLGTFFIADVGQGNFEEIDIGQSGANYGWAAYEGPIHRSPSTPLGPGTLVMPIYSYDHTVGHSITGGYVYRGESEGLHGDYFFADFVDNRYFTLHFDGAQWVATERTSQIVPNVGSLNNPSSFGEDAQGNLYVVDLDGEIFRLTPTVSSVDVGDTLSGLDGDDKVFGGSGDDSLDGGGGFDVLTGGAGNDTLNGEGDDDAIFASEGADQLTGGPGNDRLDGGAGLDSAAFSGLRSAYALTDLAGGNIQVAGPDGIDTLADIERLVFDDQTIDLPDLTVSALTLAGTTLAFNVINTGPGGAPASTTGLYLSLDSYISTADTMLATLPTPALAPEASSGQSIVRLPSLFPDNLAAGTYYIGAIADRNEQIMEARGTNNALPGTPILLGDSAANVITGTSGADIMFGRAGNDALSGGSGNDLFVGGANTITPNLGALPAQAGQMGAEWRVLGASDLGSDGKADIVWNSAGRLSLWTMNNGAIATAGATQGAMGTEWRAVGLGDFNQDGRADVLWDRGIGDVAIWEMNGRNIIGVGIPDAQMGAGWHFAGIGEFNGDGKSDVLWHSNSGSVAIWSMNGLAVTGTETSTASISAEWQAAAIGDFDGNGRDDILWQRSNGDLQFWSMNGANPAGVVSLGHVGREWRLGGVGDFNMDGKSDFVWVSNNNDVRIWLMNGGQVAQAITPPGHLGIEWQLKGVGDFTGDARPDLLWASGGRTSVWDMRGNGDAMTGGVGTDTFVFSSLSDLGKVITDFQLGAGEVLDLHDLLASIGYAGTNAIQDNIVRLIQNSGNTEVQVDAHPGEHHWLTVATLLNVTATSLIQDNFIF